MAVFLTWQPLWHDASKTLFRGFSCFHCKTGGASGNEISRTAWATIVTNNPTCTEVFVHWHLFKFGSVTSKCHSLLLTNSPCHCLYHGVWRTCVFPYVKKGNNYALTEGATWLFQSYTHVNSWRKNSPLHDSLMKEYRVTRCKHRMNCDLLSVYLSY